MSEEESKADFKKRGQDLYDRFRDEITASQRADGSQFDRAVLTLSAGFLAISIGSFGFTRSFCTGMPVRLIIVFKSKSAKFVILIYNCHKISKRKPRIVNQIIHFSIKILLMNKSC